MIIHLMSQDILVLEKALLSLEKNKCENSIFFLSD